MRMSELPTHIAAVLLVELTANKITVQNIENILHRTLEIFKAMPLSIENDEHRCAGGILDLYDFFLAKIKCNGKSCAEIEQEKTETVKEPAPFLKQKFNIKDDFMKSHTQDR